MDHLNAGLLQAQREPLQDFLVHAGLLGHLIGQTELFVFAFAVRVVGQKLNRRPARHAKLRQPAGKALRVPGGGVEAADDRNAQGELLPGCQRGADIFKCTGTGSAGHGTVRLRVVVLDVHDQRIENAKQLRQERLRMADAPDKMAPLIEAVTRLTGSVPREKLCGIGVSAPGPLDGERGRILNPPRFDLWHQTDIAPLLHEATGLPVYLENDATCLARYHIGRPESLGSRNFLLMIVDSGIGSGVVSKGKVLKGGGYYTSELGHTSIDYRGRRCACGNIGCLEEYAAIPKLLKDTPYSSWKQVVDANDEEILQREADYLSAGIVTFTNLVSIDTVLLSGDLLYGTEKIAQLLELREEQKFIPEKRKM